MSKFFLHLVPVPADVALGQKIVVEFDESFAVVGTVSNTSLELVYSDEPYYCVAGGIDGLPYISELGRPGGAPVICLLGSRPKYLLVATLSSQPPTVKQLQSVLYVNQASVGASRPSGQGDGIEADVVQLVLSLDPSANSVDVVVTFHVEKKIPLDGSSSGDDQVATDFKVAAHGQYLGRNAYPGYTYLRNS